MVKEKTKINNPKVFHFLLEKLKKNKKKSKKGNKLFKNKDPVRPRSQSKKLRT